VSGRSLAGSGLSAGAENKLLHHTVASGLAAGGSEPILPCDMVAPRRCRRPATGCKPIRKRPSSAPGGVDPPRRRCASSARAALDTGGGAGYAGGRAIEIPIPLEQGRIVERGTHAQLVTAGGSTPASTSGS
jgi:hypothetical protein